MPNLTFKNAAEIVSASSSTFLLLQHLCLLANKLVNLLHDRELEVMSKSFLKFLSPFGIATGNFCTLRASLPYVQEPNPIEAHFRKPVQSRIGISSSTAGRRSVRESSVSQTRVLTWNNDGYRTVVICRVRRRLWFCVDGGRVPVFPRQFPRICRFRLSRRACRVHAPPWRR